MGLATAVIGWTALLGATSTRCIVGPSSRHGSRARLDATSRTDRPEQLPAVVRAGVQRACPALSPAAGRTGPPASDQGPCVVRPAALHREAPRPGAGCAPSGPAGRGIGGLGADPGGRGVPSCGNWAGGGRRAGGRPERRKPRGSTRSVTSRHWRRADTNWNGRSRAGSFTGSASRTVERRPHVERNRTGHLPLVRLHGSWRGLGPPDARCGPRCTAMPLLPQPEDGPSAGDSPGTTGPDEVPLHLDLLRADLYRLLDELVRAGPEHRQGLVVEFERAWEQFKDATATAA